MNAEKSFDQKGTGYLILKSGAEEQVGWEVDVFIDGSIHDGVVRCDEMHLAKAAQDGCAVLRLTPGTTAAIVIDSHVDGEASFTTLLVSSSTFEAQTIMGSKPIAAGHKLMLVFSSATGEELNVIVPTVVMRDYLPILQKELPVAKKADPTTSFFRIAETWDTAIPRNHPYVCVIFDKDEPVALTPESARELAVKLFDGAKKSEAKLGKVQ